MEITELTPKEKTDLLLEEVTEFGIVNSAWNIAYIHKCDRCQQYFQNDSNDHVWCDPCQHWLIEHSRGRC